MELESFRDYCLSKKGASYDFPFDKTTMVFRVMGKIFAMTNIYYVPFSFNLKCDPDYALELREQYPEIQPGWHMNKKHWNTVDFEGSLDAGMLRRLIDHSYEQVVKSLKKGEREALESFSRKDKGTEE